MSLDVDTEIAALRNAYLGGYVHEGDEEKLEVFRHGMYTAVRALAGRVDRAEGEVALLKAKLAAVDQHVQENRDLEMCDARLAAVLRAGGTP